MKKLPIQFNDYRSIFNTIYSILINEDAEPSHSCLFFSIFGALILDRHYKINAKAYAGFAAYKIDKEENEILVFAEEKNGNIVSTSMGFHSWVETDEWLIDFSAPLFPKLLESMGKKSQCKAKMFQKHITDMSDSPNDLKAVGDFYLHSNLELTKELIDQFAEIQGYIDLANICNEWYRKPPKKMRRTVPVSDGFGNIKIMKLQNISLSGTW